MNYKAVFTTMLFGICFMLTACNSDNKLADTVVPVAKNMDWWQDRHNTIVAMDKSEVELVFIGDSITDLWDEEEYGLPIWQQYFGHLNSLNLGYDSDKTQHALWRVQNGEIDGMSPSYVVIMIGTNNAKSDTAEDIALGIKTIVDEVLARLPETTIILHRIFPRGNIDNPARAVTDKASELVSSQISDDRVIFADINAHFEDATGNVPRDIMYDGVHLTTKGYQVWADALMDYLL